MLVDGRFSRDQWGMISSMSLHDPPPPDTTNAFADVLGANALGSLLFIDPSLSPSNMVSCASCHEPPRQLTDGRPTSPEGVGSVTRNSPSLVLASYQPWQFWDGRADSLWGQALLPMESPNEFGSSRLFVVHDVYDLYREPYESLFGPLPPMTDLTRFPPSGMPGDASWKAMAPSDQEAVTRAFVNVGKALEAYERSLRGTSFSLDAYAAGDMGALTDPEKDGLLAYMQAGCAQCHWGPRLTDDSFHVLRFPTGRQDGTPDVGRMGGIPQYVAAEFSAGSVYSDDRSKARPPPIAGPWTLGAFKTPSLRNVALTSPYGHGGSYVALTDVVELHRTLGLPAGSKYTTGTTEPWLVPFDASQDTPIVNFLETLAMQFAH
jgi:cytochrome c peroxidase